MSHKYIQPLKLAILIWKYLVWSGMKLSLELLLNVFRKNNFVCQEKSSKNHLKWDFNGSNSFGSYTFFLFHKRYKEVFCCHNHHQNGFQITLTKVQWDIPWESHQIFLQVVTPCSPNFVNKSLYFGEVIYHSDSRQIRCTLSCTLSNTRNYLMI